MPSRDCLAGAGPLRNIQMQHQTGSPVSCGRCDGCKQRQKLAEWTSRGADWELGREEWTTVPWGINGILACVFFFLVAVLGMCVLNFPTVWFVHGGSSAAYVIPRTEMPKTNAVLRSEVSLPEHAPTYLSESVEVHVLVSDHGSTYPSESTEAPAPVSDYDYDSTYASGPADDVSDEIERLASSLWEEKLASLAASEAKTTSEDKTTSKAKTTSEEMSLEAKQSASEAKLTGESTCESKAELTGASTCETVSTPPTASSTSSEAKPSTSKMTKRLLRKLTTFYFMG
ncbi:hypothetical protein DL771_007579 [Monosporascus sp. 5C6A]|nr:hypothetical protein DL771_007579 [Monosporascus sp. 5C6A]